MAEFKDLLTIILDLKYSKFVNKKYRICIYFQCNKRANFNYKNKKQLLYCQSHKQFNMINVGQNKCIKCNSKIPAFNYKNEFKALYCADCKLDNMINIRNKKCITCNLKIPNFNYKNEKIALYCASCKLDNMIDIKNKKCINCNIKQPTFNYKNEFIALYCNDCKLDNMIDIKHIMCNTCNLVRPQVKFNNMCSGCYYYMNPDAILTRNHKSKENQIMSDLNKKLNNIIIQDKIISNGCSKRRPDGLIKLNDYNIIIEIDENQHNDYSCENKRLMEIFKDLGNSPLTIIRFNPDAYKLDNKKIKSPFGITKIDGRLKIINQKEYKNRFNKLLETINYNIKNIPHKEFNIINLFYNN